MKKIILCIFTLFISNTTQLNQVDNFKSTKMKGYTVSAFTKTNKNTDKAIKYDCSHEKQIEYINQDRYLMAEFDNYILIGVFDGHGKKNALIEEESTLHQKLHKFEDFITDTRNVREDKKDFYFNNGGYIASKAQKELPEIIKNNIKKNNDNLKQVLKDSFETFQKNLIEEYKKTKTEKNIIKNNFLNTGGCTATVCLINTETGESHIAVAGDSPGIIIRKDSLINRIKKQFFHYSRILSPGEIKNDFIDIIGKTEDHSLANESEKNRLKKQPNFKQEGNYLCNTKSSKTKYGVQPTRGFGDLPVHLNKKLDPSNLSIATPEIYSFTLDKNTALLVCSDGIFYQEETKKQWFGINDMDFIQLVQKSDTFSDFFETFYQKYIKNHQTNFDDMTAVFIYKNDILEKTNFLKELYTIISQEETEKIDYNDFD